MSETLPLEPSASKARAIRPGASEYTASLPALELGQLPTRECWEASVELVLGSNAILLICHVSPDCDAIGSLLGLGLALRILGKTPTLACESTPPEKFSFLPGFGSIVSKVDPTRFDLVIGLDSSDVKRLGSVYDTERFATIPLINIDHHITNLFFGDINLVDPRAASTAEIVLKLLDHLGISLVPAEAFSSPTRFIADDVRDQQNLQGIAICLLTGIVTDTLGFRTSNVTPPVMAAAMRLMEAGASLSQVTHYAFNQRPLVELNLLARGLSHVQAKDGLAWSEITLDDRHACGLMDNADIGLVGLLARTKEVHMAAVFTEIDNRQIEIGFRADPDFDVAQVALSLGGGGHPAASGCTFEGSLEAAKARVLPMLRAALEEQRKAKKASTSDT